MRFEHTSVVISGGDTGNGTALAARFRKEGVGVIVIGRRSEPLG